jgi:hypothetical protein
MLRRPPVTQIISPTVGNGHPITDTAPTASTSVGLGPPTKRSVSNTTTSAVNQDQDFNTDELFTKHTISEIRLIQNRLRYVLYRSLSGVYIILMFVSRTDADARKEELRQMVGCVRILVVPTGRF